MLHKTRGIVLSYIKYRDTSVIVRVFTENFGLQSYIINGIRSKSSKKSLALLQPLTLLDLVVYKKKNQGGINRLSEYKPAITFTSIPCDIKKSTIALFIAEWMSQVHTEEEPDQNVQFTFLFESIEIFDQLANNFENFHLQLLIKSTHFLGFGINTTSDLDLEGQVKGEYYHLKPLVLRLGNSSYSEKVDLNYVQRQAILEFLIAYYHLHIESIKEIKSLAVLKEVFHP